MTSQEFKEVNQEISIEIDGCLADIKNESGGSVKHQGILDLMMESVITQVRRHTQQYSPDHIFVGLGKKEIEEGPVIVEESEDDSFDENEVDPIQSEEHQRKVSILKKDIGAKLAVNIKNKLKASQLKENLGSLLKGKV